LLHEALDHLDSALCNGQLFRNPFPHSRFCGLFDEISTSAILNWLERDAPWKFVKEDFYTRRHCAGLITHLRETAAKIAVAPDTLQMLRQHMGRLFGVRFNAERVEVLAQQMLPGHRIGIHNDAPRENSETHRLIINFNRGFQDENGGHLILLDIQDPENTAVIVPPLHNSAVALEFSASSWHCVEEVKAGSRYSLAYSFWTAS
jgi:hypothetical protein